MKQWSLRITAYADRLLSGLDTIDWPDSIKEIQRNWIGKSKGTSVVFNLEHQENSIEVFTTRPDTIFGVGFMVLAPEHDMVNSITTDEYLKEVTKYIEKAKLKSERDRQMKKQFQGFYRSLCYSSIYRKKSSDLDWRLCTSFIWDWGCYGCSLWRSA